MNQSLCCNLMQPRQQTPSTFLQVTATHYQLVVTEYSLVYFAFFSPIHTIDKRSSSGIHRLSLTFQLAAAGAPCWLTLDSPLDVQITWHPGNFQCNMKTVYKVKLSWLLALFASNYPHKHMLSRLEKVTSILPTVYFMQNHGSHKFSTNSVQYMYYGTHSMVII